MRLHEVNKLNNFISGWYIDNEQLMQDIIDYHKISPDRSPGKIGSQQSIDIKVKDSVDCDLTKNDQLTERYAKELKIVLDAYIKQYPECNKCAPFGVTEGINIQRYLPNGGYHGWHCERSEGKSPMTSRHLVFMTYLNDIDDAGETEFLYQQTKIRPERGLTLIWPTDWTHYHRGIASATQEKYIVTGWFSFKNL